MAKRFWKELGILYLLCLKTNASSVSHLLKSYILTEKLPVFQIGSGPWTGTGNEKTGKSRSQDRKNVSPEKKQFLELF